MFDLDAYLARIALARPENDGQGLAAVQRAHRLAIPFENLDVLLGRPIRIESDAVFAKLVTAKRGGYCFEHNRLLLDALAALGFAARPLLARVWLDAVATPPLAHALTLVDIGGEPWIADAGFGGSYAPPMRLSHGEEVMAPDGARFRLTETDGTWLLERDGPATSTDGRGNGAGFQRQYSFTLADVHDSDLALSNHWTSTAPESRFTRHIIASIVLREGFARLTDRHYARATPRETRDDAITDPRVYRMRLSLMFGIDLTREEADHLFEAAGRGLALP